MGGSWPKPGFYLPLSKWHRRLLSNAFWMCEQPLNDKTQQRIGLFGGTFDPVHFGHLRPAIELAEAYGLDHLHLLPNHRPVHRGAPTATTEQRIAMLALATESQPQLVVDSREANRDKPSYTFDTLTEFRAEFPDATLIFFMGLDAYSEFDTWHRWQDILELANLVVVDRPDAQLSDWSANLLDVQQERCGDSVIESPFGAIERRNVTQLAISATDIRQRIAMRKSIDFLVPECVKQYIVTHKLYQQ